MYYNRIDTWDLYPKNVFFLFISFQSPINDPFLEWLTCFTREDFFLFNKVNDSNLKIVSISKCLQYCFCCYWFSYNFFYRNTETRSEYRMFLVYFHIKGCNIMCDIRFRLHDLIWLQLLLVDDEIIWLCSIVEELNVANKMITLFLDCIFFGCF